MLEKEKLWIWISALTIMGHKKKLDLLKFFGDTQSLWNASRIELIESRMLNDKQIDGVLSSKSKDFIEQIYFNMKKENMQIVGILDDTYPEALKNIYDPPVALYFKGNLVRLGIMIAVIGARKASTYGLSCSYKFSKELSEEGITIVSGAARGIDTKAHRGALDFHGKTIAVLGCGLDIAYPPENLKLIEEIAEKGLVISEFIPGTKPFNSNFPLRNRIISGLSLGTLVVEAGEKSGAIITANLALEQGKDVFAIPGNIDSYNSLATNQLIKDGAKMVTRVEDILEEINTYHGGDFYKVEDGSAGIMNKFVELTEQERQIMDQLHIEALHIDQIKKKTGFEIQLINATLTLLELKGAVEQLPGKIFKSIMQI